MVFISGSCRLELSVEKDQVVLEVSKGDQHQRHLMPLHDYAQLLNQLASFNKEVMKEVSKPVDKPLIIKN